MSMDIRKIKNLIELIEASSIAEIEIVEGDDSVRITRVGSNTQVSLPHQNVPQSNYAQFPGQMASFAAPQMPAALSETATSSNADVPEGRVIKSPMVGTFYRSASPTSKTFVELGQEIVAGEVICIIEAMKMFNQIESDHSGKVVKILVENGQSVEFDQPLMIVE